MYVGHINLVRSMNGMGEHFVKLIEGLDRQGLQQHVLVSNAALARRVAVYENVLVGPVVRTAVMAYCLMPDVDVAHVHDQKANQAGLVLRLTRSMPYVVTRRSPFADGNTISRSMLSRAAGIICADERVAGTIRDAGLDVPVDVIEDISYEKDDETTENSIAAQHHRIYRRAVDTRRIPAMLL